MGLNPIEALDSFLGFLCNCLSCFTTAKITSCTSMSTIAATVLYFQRAYSTSVYVAAVGTHAIIQTESNYRVIN